MPRPSLALALLLMGVSGAVALGYQIAWTRQATAWLGHESAAVLAVVAAFFGGLAFGALLLGPRVQRSSRPGRWYAGCEALAAAWALALAGLIDPASRALLLASGEQPSALRSWSVAFAGTFVLLLPATAAMGATLPALDQLLAHWRERGRTLALLYAANTAGAMVGVLGVAFVLVPRFGLLHSAALCAALGAVAATVAWRAFEAPGPSPVAAAPADTGAGAGAGAGADTRAAGMRGNGCHLWTLAATGLLGIGCEVLVVRMLSQVTEATVYSFALLLAVYLGGTALGAAVWARRVRTAADGSRAADHTSRRLLHALAAAVLASTALLWSLPALKQLLLAAAQAAFGPGLTSALATEAGLALLVFLVPTALMGALFAQLAAQARAQGLGFARALGSNTLGAALAPLVFGVAAVSLVGTKGAWLLLAAGYLVLASLGRGAPRPGAVGAALAGATLALALWLPPLVIAPVPPGGRLLSHAEGALGSVSVIEDAGGTAWLHIDNHQPEGSSATRLADARLALLPLLLHPAPREALFLGLGTGVTAYSAAQDRQLGIDVVELLPQVIDASARFTQELAAGLPAGQVRLHAGDARRWVRRSESRYDLVVADNVHPARSGSGALYTVEHFAAVRERLADGGLFCQWLPLHQLDLHSLRSVVRSFLDVYPDAVALLASNSLDTPVLGLLARRGGTRFHTPALRARLDRAALDPPAAAFGLNDEWAVLGSVVASAASLHRFAAGAVANSDDRPVVAHAAPRLTYAPDAQPRDRLLALIAQLHVDPAALLDAAGAAEQAQLAAYVRARNGYLAAGRDVQPSADPRRMLAQVQAPLLEALRTSPDFRPAYEPLLRLAQALGAQDPEAARTLLAELARLQPARPEAMQLSARLAGGAADAPAAPSGRP